MRSIDADWLLSFIRLDEKVIAPERHTAQDIIMMIQTAPTIEPPPNAPLTLEELREMDGEPVWCINGNVGQWGLVHVFSAEGETYVECVTKTGFKMDKMTYGAMGIYAWLAYRRRPEEA